MAIQRMLLNYGYDPSHQNGNNPLADQQALLNLSERKPLNISCSSVSFLSPCDACIWREHHDVRHPRGPFPSVFRQIDGINREFYSGKTLKSISADLPEGFLDTGELSVRSEVFEINGIPFFFNGRLDALGTRSDGGGFVVPDFKTVDVKTQHLEHYALQLNAYALALENPAPGKPRLAPVTDIGLLCLMPRVMKASPTGKLGYIVEPSWVPLERDDQGLLDFIYRRILRVLELPEIPASDPVCQWCQFVETVQKSS